MPDHKYVLKLRAVGANIPVKTLRDTFDNAENASVWSDGYTVSERTTVNGTPVLVAHIPYYSEKDALDAFDELRGITGVLNSADEGYLHVHECMTGGGPEKWDCSEHIVREVTV